LSRVLFVFANASLVGAPNADMMEREGTEEKEEIGNPRTR